MSTRVSFVLMILFIVLGSFALFDPFQMKEKAEKQKDVENHVFWLKEKRVASLKLRDGAATVELQCAKAEGCPFDGTGDWQIVAPVKDRADSATVGSLLSSTFNLTQNETIDLPGADPKEFGLDAPKYELELRVVGEGEPYHLKVGMDSSTGPANYASSNRAPGKIYLLPNYYSAMLHKDLFHWRNKRLFPEFTPDQITGLDWKGGAESRIVAEKAAGGWRIKTPVDGQASALLIEGLATTVVYSAAKTIFSEARTTPEAKKVLAGKPLYDIAFTAQGDKKGRMLAYARVPGKPAGAEVVVEVPGQERLFNVDATEFVRFARPVLEYRERRIFAGGELSRADEMIFTFPREKKTIGLKLQGSDDWVSASGEKPAEELSRARLRMIVQALGAAEALGFVASEVSSNPAFAFFAKNPADFELELRAGGQSLKKARFTVYDRSHLLTEGEGRTVREYGTDLAKALPVRLGDLYESANKKVVIPATPEEEHGEHSHDHP